MRWYKKLQLCRVVDKIQCCLPNVAKQWLAGALSKDCAARTLNNVHSRNCMHSRIYLHDLSWTFAINNMVVTNPARNCTICSARHVLGSSWVGMPMLSVVINVQIDGMSQNVSRCLEPARPVVAM